ncbi:MAG TPA: outer membrane protein transport protein [Anaeromyxobacter sp.]|nr:outer membrane protein transport protein [Anaeromyxobacter sp.]
MRNVSLRFTAVFAALAVAAPAAATNGMRMIGFGPVQNSMGGASIAAPLDATVTVTNPAGLSALAPRVDLAGQAFMPSVEYDATWSMGGPPADVSQESDRPTDFLPTLAGVFKVQDKLTLGLAALGTAGMGVEYSAGGLYGSETLTSYLNFRVAPAAAYRVTDALSLGLAVNLMYAQMEYDVMEGMLLPHDAVGSFGYGATVGVTFKASEMVTLGAAYETKSFFQDFEFDVAGETQALDFDQPMIASVGAAVRPLQGLLVAADVQWINWSDTMGKDLPEWSANPLGEPAWNMNWDDQVVFKLGAEYALAAVKGLAIRAGYNYGASPVDTAQAFETIAFPAIAEHHFTVGAGYETPKFAVNFAAVYSPEATASASSPTQPQGIPDYEVRMSQLAFELGAAYRF